MKNGLLAVIVFAVLSQNQLGVCHAAVDIFLFIPGINGETIIQGRTNWHNVRDISWGHGQPAPGTGTKVVFDLVTFKKFIDGTSPAFALAAATGQPFGTPQQPVLVEFVRSGGDPSKPPIAFAKLELTNVRVVQYKAAGSADHPGETVALSFTTIKWIIHKISPTGSMLPVVAGWDLVNNAPTK